MGDGEGRAAAVAGVVVVASPVDRDARTATRRALVFLGAGLVAAVDLAAKAWAQRALTTTGVELGPVDLRLGYNSGVAFSVAAGAPAAAVVAVTGLITAAVAVLAWRVAVHGSRLRRTGVASVLGGAVANLVDRAGDGRVTDYLHTGWWPTFNLADTAIVTGAGLFILAELRSGRQTPSDRSGREASASAHSTAEEPGR